MWGVGAGSASRSTTRFHDAGPCTTTSLMVSPHARRRRVGRRVGVHGLLLTRRGTAGGRPQRDERTAVSGRTVGAAGRRGAGAVFTPPFRAWRAGDGRRRA